MANKIVLSSLILSFLSILGVFSENVRRYDGYSVIRLKPKTESQLEFLKDLEKNNLELNFWRSAYAIDRNVDIMIPPHLNQTFEKMLLQRNFVQQTLIDDLEKLTAGEKIAPKGSTRLVWTQYYRYADILAFQQQIASANPTLAQVQTIGQSYEKRDIRVTKIGVGVGGTTKPIIFIDCGIHAREWIAPAFCTYLIQYLIDNSGGSTVGPLLQKFDWYIVPCANPDGYEYSQVTDRMWRKTRKPNSGSTCVGVDPNRNFAFGFGGAGTSTNPCSDTFKGPSAFSEPETKALSDYILSKKNNIKMYTAVHSYGHYWLYSWGHNTSVTPHNAALNALGKLAVDALSKPYGTKYALGTGAQVLYAAAGGADDWGYGSAGIIYSYTVELRDTGTYGFRLPASQIKPCSEETTMAYIAAANGLATALNL